jgi:ribosomal protein S18 acetylase RimI-like enzyme
MSQIVIREYECTDRDACIAIFKSNIPNFFAENELAFFITWLDAQDEEQVAYKNAMEQDYFVAVQEGRIVGCGGFYITRDDKVARLAWGMVDNSLHKQGIGKALLIHRISSIEILFPGYKITLDTTQHSCGFFEKLGFKTEKITKDFYAPGMDRYDMVLE